MRLSNESTVLIAKWLGVEKSPEMVRDGVLGDQYAIQALRMLQEEGKREAVLNEVYRPACSAYNRIVDNLRSVMEPAEAIFDPLASYLNAKQAGSLEFGGHADRCFHFNYMNGEVCAKCKVTVRRDHLGREVKPKC